MESIKVQAPATVANVGCGYDTIGFALDGVYEEIVVSKRKDERLVIQSIEGADLPLDYEQNVATIAVKSLLDHVGVYAGFDFHIKKFFNPGSGLGSSASSAAGAVYAVNELLSSPLQTSELLPFALEGEAFASKCYHADNVAPSLLGGFVVIRSYDPLDYFALPLADELHVLIIRPSVEIKTSEAKGIVPKFLDIATTRNQWGNLASLVHALHVKDWGRLKVSIDDFIAEPVRKTLIPGYEAVRAITHNHECVGFNISGSGPSMFALFSNAENLAMAKFEIQELYAKKGSSCDFFESQMSDQGCKVIEGK